jgi:DNA-binding IclR family transcriptional regulator
MPREPGYQAPSVKRALQILELVAESRRGLGISELARRLEISKGTVYGICGQLEAGGALVRDPASKRYGLGPLAATLAGRSFVYTRLRDSAGPELGALCDQLRESVFLGVLSRRDVTVVDSRQPTGRIGVVAVPGTRLPLTAGAVGRVLLAGMPPAAVDSVLGSKDAAAKRRGKTAPRLSPEQLDQARRQGYAVESGEYMSGLWGAAAALGADLILPTAVWAVGFTSELSPGRLEEIGLRVKQAADRITLALQSPGG